MKDKSGAGVNSLTYLVLRVKLNKRHTTQSSMNLGPISKSNFKVVVKTLKVISEYKFIYTGINLLFRFVLSAFKSDVNIHCNCCITISATVCPAINEST